jgi:hypothetical protein
MITAWSHKRLVQCQEARPGSFDPGLKVGYPIPQDPTACLVVTYVISSFHAGKPAVLDIDGACSSPYQHSTHELTPAEHSSAAGSAIAYAIEMLLRKEVIQPHLPVRLPCYDFVPITSPTFDSSFPCGLGHWLRVLPTFVT